MDLKETSSFFTKQSWLGRAVVIYNCRTNQLDRLVREPQLSRAGFRFVLPKHTEELTMPAQKRLRLDDKERLFPCPNHSSEKYQEHSICFPVNWSFDLSTQDDQLVSQQGVFRQPFSFASGQVSKCAGYKGGREWFDPTPNTFLERMRAKTGALLDRGKYTQHEWNLFFVKIGAWSERMHRMDRVDCPRISPTLARKLAPSCTIGPIS
jgi:hypothetical protein